MIPLLILSYLAVGEHPDWRKRSLTRRRRALRDASNPLTLPEEVFLQKFRVSKEAFEYILGKIGANDGIRRTYTPPVIRLALTLELLGSRSHGRLAGSDLCSTVAQATFSVVVSEMIQELEDKLCTEWIQLDINANTKRWFYKEFGIPGVIGCVGGTHIYFRKTSQSEETFINPSGKASVNGMVVCDHDMKIIGVNFGFPGSTHDSHVWNHSNERTYLKDHWNRNESNGWLLGGSGYPLEPWLMTPYKSAVDPTKRKYNDVHSQARSIVNRCINLYKGRWRIFMEDRKSRYNALKMGKFATVCAALHNICIHYKVKDFEIGDFTSPSPGTDWDDEVEVTVESAQLIRISEETRNGVASALAS
uniref:DDE Tnp4 domain-containing protein n=1 Tax=Glossina morsitans morsitans TaxID=37546 RepID=D3TQX7_GLOMM